MNSFYVGIFDLFADICSMATDEHTESFVFLTSGLYIELRLSGVRCSPVCPLNCQFYSVFCWFNFKPQSLNL